MANITENNIWESGIYQLETDDPTLGGPPGFNAGVPVVGHANAQAQQLANRTKYLKDVYIPQKIDEHNSDASAHPELSAFITAEADRAENAADAAMASGNIYVDTTAGLAATTNGQYFSVPSAESTEYLILYKNNAGSALEVKRYPSTASIAIIQQMIAEFESGDVFIVTDSAGHVAIRTSADGKTEFPAIGTEGFSADELGVTAETLALKTGPNLTSSQQSAQEVCDASGRCAAQVDQHGRMLLADAIIQRQFRGDWDRQSGAFDYDINHVIWYGQSWSLGFDSVPPITTTQRYNALMFNGGIRQLKSIAEDPAALQSFVPAVESSSIGTPEFPTATLGETGAVAFTHTVMDLIHRENNINIDQQSYQLLLSAPGEGSKSIEELSADDSTYLLRVYEQIDRGYAIAQSLGKTYAVQAVTWLQGSNNVSGVGYADQMEALRVKISNHAKATTGQSHEVVLITWQLMPQSDTSGNQLSAGRVYQRFVVAAETYPYIVCSGPAYQSVMVSSSNVHLRPQSSARIGEAMGLAYKRVVIDGELPKYQPLQPISLRRQGKIATLKLNVNDGYLVRDIDQVVAKTNDGFNLYDSGGSLLTIDSVSISSRDTIKITSSTTIPAGARLRYADTGTDFSEAGKRRGNIRDNSHYATGVNRWLVAFSYEFEN